MFLNLGMFTQNMRSNQYKQAPHYEESTVYMENSPHFIFTLWPIGQIQNYRFIELFIMYIVAKLERRQIQD